MGAEKETVSSLGERRPQLNELVEIFIITHQLTSPSLHPAGPALQEKRSGRNECTEDFTEDLIGLEPSARRQ